MFKAPHGRLQGTEAPVCSVVLQVVWDTSGLGSLEHPPSQLQSGRHRESYGFGQHGFFLHVQKRLKLHLLKCLVHLDNLKKLDSNYQGLVCLWSCVSGGDKNIMTEILKYRGRRGFSVGAICICLVKQRLN